VITYVTMNAKQVSAATGVQPIRPHQNRTCDTTELGIFASIIKVGVS
jgi:hypothetical protein